MHIYGYWFRNIGPFSNVATDIKFGDKALLKMLIGDNGIGKSTTIKVLKYGLYHDLAYDTGVDEIANDVNGNGEIGIEINSRGKDWTIITNFAPNKIKLFEGRGDGRVWLDKGGMPQTKKHIREQVLDIPFYIFDNILSLDVTEFKSLLTLNAEDTRKLRDRIFGFSVFNVMAEEIRKKMNTLIDERKKTEVLVTSKQNQLTELNTSIEQIKEQLQGHFNVKEAQDKVDTLRAEIDDLIIKKGLLERDLQLAEIDVKYFENSHNQKEIDTINSTITSHNNQIAGINTKQDDIDSKIAAINSYAERKALLAGKDADTVSYKEKVATFNKLKGEYDALVTESKTVSSLRDGALDIERKRELSFKYQELQKITDKINKDEDIDRAYSDKIDFLKTEITTINGNLAIMRKQHVAKVNGECSECGTKFNHPDHAKHVKALGETIAEKEADLVQFKSELDTKSRELRELRLDIAPRKSTQAILTATLNSSGMTMDEIAKINIETLPAKVDIAALDKQIADIKVKANKIKDEANAIKGQCVNLKDKIDKDAAKLKALPAMEEPKDKIEDLKKDRADCVARRTEFQQKVSDLEVNKRVRESKIHKGINPDKERPFTEEQALETQKTYPALIKEHDAKIDERSKKKFEHEKSIELANNATNLDIQSGHLRKQAEGVMLEIKGYDDSLLDLKSNIERAEHKLEIIKLAKEEVLRVYMPYVNHMVVNVCKKIGVTQRLTFDDQFVPHLYRGNREVSISSASVGQRKKMNFAVLIAITKLLKLKYGGLNIIFYDEMFSSIDEKGRPHMLEIIRQEIVENLNIHVWITNHFYFPNSTFDGYMIIESKSNFSMSREVEVGELLSLAPESKAA